jgi:hypothetical protein
MHRAPHSTPSISAGPIGRERFIDAYFVENPIHAVESLPHLTAGSLGRVKHGMSRRRIAERDNSLAQSSYPPRSILGRILGDAVANQLNLRAASAERRTSRAIASVERVEDVAHAERAACIDIGNAASNGSERLSLVIVANAQHRVIDVQAHHDVLALLPGDLKVARRCAGASIQHRD